MRCLPSMAICCASGDGEEDGTFLKLAIKDLLYLDMKLKLTSINKDSDSTQCDEQWVQVIWVMGKTITTDTDATGIVTNNGNSSTKDTGIENAAVECCEFTGHSSNGMFHKGEEARSQVLESEKQLTEEEKVDLEIKIDAALPCTKIHAVEIIKQKNNVRMFSVPYAKASFFVICKTFYSYMGFHNLMVYWIHIFRELDWLSCEEYFPQPPDSALDEKFLDDPDLCEDKLSEEAGSDGFQDAIMNIIYQDGSISMRQPATIESSEPYMDVYRNLYHLLAQSEEMGATDKWAGFVLT
ncbi:hypothetical protein OSB04_030106 [Centaurea solstitialis]|uniref:Uncharacterized protein n=1 Tax=Centaurea solstitialis TaxID=347529 RepID=A0AA38S7T4_9ASTR|nr:hypothetical protein OSB04_030106 [Centaurea solstitialis]